ncbi:chloride channel protein, CIC family [Nitrosomonas sp. Nm51]|uniref:chloride channel protein n=1 Tax=Nitrosomonas sp. Nm51 TaxID=133720 RepID=UPI0008D2787D|nr:chloride channel protein [Nitrosomonas sp. Nm51]SEQ90287.1 chloride channel protein, CIC family [Nitrosomonas sp. Nm51]
MHESVTSWREIILMALLAMIAGVVASYASLGFLWAIDNLHILFLGATGGMLYKHLETISNWHLFFLPVAGAVVVRLVVRYGMPKQLNEGPADVIEAARLGKGDLSFKAGVSSAVATIVSIGSGASVGRYGPAVHLGASIGSWLGQVFKLTAERKKNLLACGVAGAISASFSAPLAGVVFAHEVVLGRFGSRSVMPIAISSVAATAIVKMHALDNMLFILPDLPVFANWEYFLFALVGVAGGALAVIYMAMMSRFSHVAQQLPGSAMIKSLIGGVLLGGIVVVFPQTFGLGEQVIRDVLHSEMAIGFLTMLLLAKLLATSISFAAGFSGGIFGPALFLGAVMGAMCGTGVQILINMDVSPAIYGVVGMGAVVSRVIGAPIATILIVFEMTGSYLLMTAVMVSVATGGTVTRELFNRSYFYHQLRSRGVEPETSQIQQSLTELPVNTLMLKQPFALTADMTLKTARHVMMPFTPSVETAYVVDQQGLLKGQINPAMLILIDRDDETTLNQQIGCMLVTPPEILTNEMNAYQAYVQLKDCKHATVPVIDGQTRQFLGIVYVGELMHACLQAFDKFRAAER